MVDYVHSILGSSFYHEEVHILHNDIKTNILVSKYVCNDPCEYQVVLIDFGKVTKISKGKRYTLSGAKSEE